MFALLPLQAPAIVYVAGILAATSRLSPAANASLAVGAIAGLAVYGLATPDDRYVGPLVLGMVTLTFLLAALAGVAAAWLLSGTEDPQELREARIRQGLLAGSVAGAACGLLLTNFFVVAVFMMVIGPLLGVTDREAAPRRRLTGRAGPAGRTQRIGGCVPAPGPVAVLTSGAAVPHDGARHQRAPGTERPYGRDADVPQPGHVPAAGGTLEEAAVLALADEIELVDAPPSLLADRARRGEIVPAGGVQDALRTDYSAQTLGAKREQAFGLCRADFAARRAVRRTAGGTGGCAGEVRAPAPGHRDGAGWPATPGPGTAVTAS